MNMKRLRELKDQFVTENYGNDSMTSDVAAVAAIDKFFNFVKTKEKERKANDFKPDPSPMIGTNPFRKDAVSDGDHLFIPPTETDRGSVDERFNRLLNYRVETSVE